MKVALWRERIGHLNYTIPYSDLYLSSPHIRNLCASVAVGPACTAIPHLVFDTAFWAGWREWIEGRL
ncbi:hypothetical protein BofuT4_uP036670.1 [Botrytis cinerea T4]|uniref:Uncharacterized protein n=1 Tax=Botryotinia fuckeliana (strain T4) TaxID=999810 RepID=G2Y4U7_BOTF4|nr:hypothetical protein BofuT4_uP036670.1 [Botrytis cinerea T4]